MSDLAAVQIRPMLRDDVARASTAILDGGWGDRRDTLQFYARHDASKALVAEYDGEIVGTSVATYSGSVGWLGLVFVAPAWRGKGLGAELTRNSLSTLDQLGCTTVLLAASELGKPIYDRVGFVEDAGGGYTLWHGTASRAAPVDPRIRPLTLHDLPRVYAIDRAASDEDRAHAIRALATGWVFDDGECIRGYALRTPWGLGPAVTDGALANDGEPIGALLLDVLIAHARSPRVRLIVPASNTGAAAALRSRGFVEDRTLPRMRLGQPVAWDPRRIWAIFNFAMG